MMQNSDNYDDVKTHTTEAVTQSETGMESVTVSDKSHVQTDTETESCQRTTNLFETIQYGSVLLSRLRDETQWASDFDMALQDDYDGVMRWLYEDEQGDDYHPYFNNRNTPVPYWD
jgi:hypothetical protein